MADAERLTLTLSSGGDVVIKLRPDLAPGHVERITIADQEGFYDGVVFHRVIPGFMAQGGDPTGTGTGGSDLPNLKAEFSREPHVRGVASMARTHDPNSANSQFFICLDDATLPRQPVYGLGRGRERHGTCRRAPGRRAAARARQDREGDRGVSRWPRHPARDPDHRRVGRARRRIRAAVREARRGSGAGRSAQGPARRAGRGDRRRPCHRRRPGQAQGSHSRRSPRR